MNRTNETNETVLTTQIYENLITKLTRDIIRLKKAQGQTITEIEAQKEALKILKEQLKQTKKEIRITSRKLSLKKKSLRAINGTLRVRNNSVMELNSAITSEEDQVIDLNRYSLEQAKRR